MVQAGPVQKQAALHCSLLHSTPNPSDGSAADRSSGMKRRGQAVCCNRGKRCDVQKRLSDTVECTSRRYGATSSGGSCLQTTPPASQGPNELGKHRENRGEEPRCPEQNPNQVQARAHRSQKDEPRCFLNETKSDVYMPHSPKEPLHPSNLASRRAVCIDGEGLGEFTPNVGSQLTFP